MHKISLFVLITLLFLDNKFILLLLILIFFIFLLINLFLKLDLFTLNISFFLLVIQ